MTITLNRDSYQNSMIAYDVIKPIKLSAIQQSSNLYTYCGNNPMIYVDPTGYGFWESVGNIAESTLKGAISTGLAAGLIGGFSGVGFLPAAGAGVISGGLGGFFEGVIEEIWP